MQTNLKVKQPLTCRKLGKKNINKKKCKLHELCMINDLFQSEHLHISLCIVPRYCIFLYMAFVVKTKKNKLFVL